MSPGCYAGDFHRGRYLGPFSLGGDIVDMVQAFGCSERWYDNNFIHRTGYLFYEPAVTGVGKISREGY